MTAASGSVTTSRIECEMDTAIWKVLLYLVALCLVTFFVCVPLIPVIAGWAVFILLAWIFASTVLLIVWVG